jgi:hypothetical protein
VNDYQRSVFESSVRYHLDNGPETWHVEKKAERRWAVVDAAGGVVSTATTKRQAEEDLTSGTYFRIWHERDEWYRDTSRDPRNRAFTPEEQAILDRLLK